MEDSTKSFSVAFDVKAKHGRLFQWIKERGLTNADVSRMTGITQSQIGRIVNMQFVPKNRGRSKKTADALVLLTGIPYEELFPYQYVQAIDNEEIHAKHFTVYKNIPLDMLPGVNYHEPIAPPDEIVEYREKLELVREAMDKVLTENEKRIIEARFFDDTTIEEAAKRTERQLNYSRTETSYDLTTGTYSYGETKEYPKGEPLTRERVRQLEKHALYKIKEYIRRKTEENKAIRPAREGG